GLAVAEPELPADAGGAEQAAVADPSGTAPGAGPPVPQPRPDEGTGAAGAATAGQGQTASQEEVDRAVRLAARAALSRIQIQLGAFTDRAFTEAEWRRIAETNSDLLDGRALAIQPTTSGGTKFYRLRVGPFDDRAEASRVCEALQARGQDCLVAENS
ncbi:MAG TPA: SPOR domain-containing protein, partial [Thermohalobaculum sp.]|nr:SPOR domain-containing protein [Thermohalobaculum sp.]